MADTAATQSGTRVGPRKHEAVERLSEKLSRATSAVVTDYRGLTVHQLEELRGPLRAQGVKPLAELPSREALLSQLAGTLLSPLTQLAGALDSITATFASTLEAYRAKLAAAA